MSRPTTIVRVLRHFDASPERVFDAWLDPKTAGRWLFATPTGKMLQVDMDARVGGGFHITEQRGEVKAEHIGKYLEIERPGKLVFTFGGPGFPDTTVTVEIRPSGKSCDLQLTHEQVWAEYAERTKGGWTMILDSLAKQL